MHGSGARTVSGGSRPVLGVAAAFRGWLGVALALGLSGACGGAEGPAPRVFEDPGVKVRSIARVWQELSVDEGVFDRDPNGVERYRIETRISLELGEGSAREVVTRDELFRMRDGREFHCKTQGVVPVRVRYRREREEIRLDLDNDATALRRSCREPGFPVLSKEVPGASVTFALRSERLLAIHPAQVRATLLPVQ